MSAWTYHWQFLSPRPVHNKIPSVQLFPFTVSCLSSPSQVERFNITSQPPFLADEQDCTRFVIFTSSLLLAYWHHLDCCRWGDTSFVCFFEDLLVWWPSDVIPTILLARLHTIPGWTGLNTHTVSSASICLSHLLAMSQTIYKVFHRLIDTNLYKFKTRTRTQENNK
jgi:hypothetical protein